MDAAVDCFWRRGYEATSVRDLIDKTGLTGASLYNAFGDKRALFRAALQHYVDSSIGERIRRCEALPPRAAIRAFFQEILNRSLTDRAHKGCLLVNSALEIAPHDEEFRAIIAGVLTRIEVFFRATIEAGQRDGSIAAPLCPEQTAHHLLGVLMGVRVLARVRPEGALLEGAVAPALALLDDGGRPAPLPVGRPAS